MQSLELTVSHLSLWHSADPDGVAEYVHDVARVDGSDVITTTETNAKMAKAIRRRMGKGWVVGHKDEHVIAWSKRALGRWRRLYLSILTRIPFWNPRGKLMLFAFVGVRMRWGNGPIRFLVSHVPSDIQDGFDWNGETRPRIKATKAGLRRWGNRVRKWADKHPDGVQVLCMDSNLDQHYEVWRTRLNGSLGSTSVWQVKVPVRGTHGHRLIDTAHVDGPVKVVGAWITSVAQPDDVDHRGISFIIRRTR